MDRLNSILFPLPNISVSSKFQQMKCGVLQDKNGLTQRAADWWDSAAFMSIVHARRESCSRSFLSSRPPAANASRWATCRIIK